MSKLMALSSLKLFQLRLKLELTIMIKLQFGSFKKKETDFISKELLRKLKLYSHIAKPDDLDLNLIYKII